MAGAANTCSALCLVLGFLSFKASAAETSSLSLDESKGRLVIEVSGKPMLVYVFATNQFKPYVQSLYSLSGIDVLRDSPPDHLHHHGLMYAIRVNGVNFWEETGQPGIEKPVQLLDSRTDQDKQGRPEARFTQLIHWVTRDHRWTAPTTPVALLIERRTLTVTVDESAGEVALRWHAAFEVGMATNRVVLTGSNYNGLGLRLPEAFDHSALHINSEQTPYAPAQSGDVTPARWSAVSQPDLAHQPMVALFGRPSNPGGTRFFAMLNPFAYLSVTQNLDKNPIEYRTGESFQIDYLLCVYSERKSEAFLEERYHRWEKD